MKRSLPILALLLLSPVSFAWDLKPDPPAEKVWAPKPGLSIPNPRRSFRVEFAHGNGPFVLLGDRDSVREVYDLRTGERTAQFNCREDRNSWQPEHLSPDGRVWATSDTYSQLRLVDTASGRVRGTSQLQGGGVLRFAGPDRVVALVYPLFFRIPDPLPQKLVVQVFSTADAKPLAAWTLDLPTDKHLSQVIQGFDVSPGRAYFAIVGLKTLAIHSLTDGRKLAELDLPAGGVRKSEQSWETTHTFSADGSEFAYLTGSGGGKVSTLAVWNLKDGTRTDTAVERSTQSGESVTPTLAPVLSGGWLIDGSRVWVNGKLLRSLRQPVSEQRLAITPELVIGRAWVEGSDDVPIAAIPETPRPRNENDIRPEFLPKVTRPTDNLPKPPNPRFEVFDGWWVWAAAIGGGVLVFSAALATVIALVAVRAKRPKKPDADSASSEEGDSE